MSYKLWAKEHAKKHSKIIDKLLALGHSKEQIIEYFKYENMKLCEPDFCELYANGAKCHDMPELNCYFCACPNFRFSDVGIRSNNEGIVYSECSIASKDSAKANFDGKIHQDCSTCTVPHEKEYIQKIFDMSWSNAMSECEISSI